MNSYRFRLLITLLLIVVLGAVITACGGDEEPTPTPEPQPVNSPVPPPTEPPAPTDTPVPPPTETPVPEPAVKFMGFESPATGVSIDYPAEWFTDGFEGFTTFASNEALLDSPDPGEKGGVALLISGEDASFDSADPVEMINQTIDEFDIASEVEIIDGPTAVTINGHAGAVVAMQGLSDNDIPISVFITVVTESGNTVIFLAATPSETEGEFQPIFEAMANSVQVTEPTAPPLPESNGFLLYGDIASGSVTGSDPSLWEFIGLEGEVVDVIVRPKTEELDVVFDLLDESGNSVLPSEIDDSFGIEELREFALPTSGTYIIAISGFADSTGDYEITLAEAGSPTGTEGSIGYGETLAGSVVSEAGSTWSFSGEAGDFVDITVVPYDEFDLVVDVLDASSISILDEGPLDDSFDTEFVRVLPLPGSETYTIVVTGYEGEIGDYDITLDLSNGGQPGSIVFAADTLTEEDTDGHAFPFTAGAGEIVTFLVDPEIDFDAVIEIINDDTDEILDEVDQTTGFEEMVFIVPEDGNYYFKVRGFEDSFGDYDATLLGSDLVIFELAIGDGVIGRFNDDGIIEYIFRGFAGDTLVLSAETNDELDLVLELLDLDDNSLVLVDEMTSGGTETLTYSFSEDLIVFIRVSEFFSEQGQFILLLDSE